jgi:hypothetical protein
MAKLVPFNQTKGHLDTITSAIIPFLYYNPDNKKLLYSVYNFDFSKYLQDNQFILTNYKYSIFCLFLIQNFLLIITDSILLNGSDPLFIQYLASKFNTIVPGFIELLQTTIQTTINTIGTFNVDSIYGAIYLMFSQKYLSFFNDQFIISMLSLEASQFYIHPLMTRYFTDITDDINEHVLKYGIFNLNFSSTTTKLLNVNPDIYCQRQFNLIPYNDYEFTRIQDYFYMDDLGNKYTKYNFNFELYASDFNLFSSSKLVIFTNFTSRNCLLSACVIMSIGCGLYPPYSKYFDVSPAGQSELETYLLNYSVMTMANSYKSFDNINWISFQKVSSLVESIDETKEQFMRNYQFQQLPIPFNQQLAMKNTLIKQSICTVYLNNETTGSFCTGFLFDGTFILGDNAKLVVTTSHLLDGQKDITFFYASFSTYSLNDYPSISCVGKYLIIGYDETIDIMIGLLDETDSFNVQNNVSLRMQQDFPNLELLSLNVSSVNMDDKIKVIGNLNNFDNLSSISGNVINPKYSNGLDYSSFEDGLTSELILADINVVSGSSGSPAFNEEHKIVGMVAFKVKTPDNNVFPNLIIPTYILTNVIRYMLYKWQIVQSNLQLTSPLFNVITKTGFPKVWLGINTRNYSPSNKNDYCFHNFNYNGGIVIDSFIYGYNTLTNSLITNMIDLNDKNAIPVISPLFNSTMMNRFIDSNCPIVLKSVKMYDVLTSSYSEIYLGKFSNQSSYSRITYGVSPMATNRFEGASYANVVIYKYPLFTLKYYYYNGSTWVEETEVVGGNSPDWYVVNTHANLEYYQHKLEYPVCLWNYKPNNNKIELVDGIIVSEKNDGLGSVFITFKCGNCKHTNYGSVYSTKTTLLKCVYCRENNNITIYYKVYRSSGDTAGLPTRFTSIGDQSKTPTAGQIAMSALYGTYLV